MGCNTELTLWSAEEIMVITSDVVTSGKGTLFHVILRLKISANEAPAITQHYSKWNVLTKLHTVCEITQCAQNYTYDSLSDVGEIRVYFASKILTPCRMH